MTSRPCAISSRRSWRREAADEQADHGRRPGHCRYHRVRRSPVKGLGHPQGDRPRPRRPKPGGGLLPQTVEARPVLVHAGRGPVAGIVAPRPGYDERRPNVEEPEAPFTTESFDIYLGVATEAEARALGVSV